VIPESRHRFLQVINNGNFIESSSFFNSKQIGFLLYSSALGFEWTLRALPGVVYPGEIQGAS
jgi:hypothetical protein